MFTEHTLETPWNTNRNCMITAPPVVETNTRWTVKVEAFSPIIFRLLVLFVNNTARWSTWIELESKFFKIILIIIELFYEILVAFVTQSDKISTDYKILRFKMRFWWEKVICLRWWKSIKAIVTRVQRKLIECVQKSTKIEFSVND